MFVTLFQHTRQNVSYWMSRPRHIFIAVIFFSFAIFAAHAMLFSCLDSKGALTSISDGICYRSKTLNGEIISSHVIGPYIQNSVHDVLLYVPIIIVLMILFVDIAPSTSLSRFSLRAFLNRKTFIIFTFLYASGYAVSYDRAKQLGLGTDHQIAWNILGLPVWVFLVFSLLYIFYKKVLRK